MKNEILLKIREEVSNRLQNLDKDNDYARKREEVEFEAVNTEKGLQAKNVVKKEKTMV